MDEIDDLSDDAEHTRRSETPASPEPERQHDIVQVKYLPSDGKIGPLLVSTPGLDVDPNLTYDAYVRDPDYKRDDIYDDEQAKAYGKDEFILHTSPRDTLDYIIEENTEDDCRRHLLGVYDPDTGLLEVMDAKRMVLHALVRDKSKEVEMEEKDPVNSSRKRNLGTAFGTRTAQKADKARQGARINQEEDHGDEAVSTAAYSQLTEIASVAAHELQAGDSGSKPKPQPHLSADRPEDVYPVNELIKSFHLLKVDGLVAAAEDDGPGITSRFVARRIQDHITSDQTEQLKTLAFMQTAIQFLDVISQSKRQAGKYAVPKPSELKERVTADNGVLDAIKNQFASSGFMTSWDMNYLTSHLCALSLRVDGYATEMADLARDLRMDSARLEVFYRELGCGTRTMDTSERSALRLSKSDSATHKIATLRVPLDFPVPRKAILRR